VLGDKVQMDLKIEVTKSNRQRYLNVTRQNFVVKPKSLVDVVHLRPSRSKYDMLEINVLFL
jgi:hypothetical protein